MDDRITIERETLERLLSDYDSAAGNDGTLRSWNRAIGNILDLLRAALAAQPTPAAVPLTDGDCIALMLHLNAELRQTDSPTQMVIAIARAIERAHGIAAAGDKP
jgi:hypothetical protein